MFGDVEYFWDAVRKETERVVRDMISQPRCAIVTSWDPATHSAKFMLQPENVPTAWVHVGVQGGGDGFGTAVAPHIGQQAMLIAQEGDSESWHVQTWLHSDADKPMNLQAGEWRHQTQGGTFLFFDKDDKVTLQHKNGDQVIIDGSQILAKRVDGSQLVIDSSQVILKRPDGSLVQLAAGAATVKDAAGGSLVVKDGNVTLKDASGGIFQASGGNINVTSGSGGKVEANGGSVVVTDAAGKTTTFAGGTVKIGVGSQAVQLANGSASSQLFTEH